MNKHKKIQNGASLLEVLAYLGVAAVILVGSISLLSSSNSSSDSVKTVKEVTGLMTSTKALFAGRGNYGVGSINQALIASKSVPTSMGFTPAGVITNTFGGDVTVTGVGGNVEISFDKVPKEVCANVVSKISAIQFIKVNINSVDGAIPMRPETSATACGLLSNKVIWTIN